MSSFAPIPMTETEVEIAALVLNLRETEKKLQVLTGGQVDAITGATGQPFLLHEAQEKLLRSETRYRSLAIATSQIVWATNAEGLVIEKLPEWQAFTGQSDEEIMGYGCQRAIHPDDQKRTFETWTQAVASRKSYHLEYRLRRFDGVYRDFAVSAVPVVAANGSISEWVGCCMDITDKKLANEQLAGGQALLRMASRIGRLGAWQANVSTNVVTWSDETAAIHEEPAGYSPPVIDAINYYAPAYRESIRVAFENCANLGNPFDLEAQIITSTGRPIWVRAMGEAVMDSSGLIVRVQGALQEISALKLIEATMRQKDELIRMASRLTRTGGWSLETATERVFWSDDLCDILEFPHSVSPTLGEALALYPESSRESITSAMEASARDGTPFDLESEVNTGKGNSIWARVCGERECDANGVCLRVWGAFQDITQRKLTEEKIQAQLIQLQRWHETTLNREDRVRAVKQEANEALLRAGGSRLYDNPVTDEDQLLFPEPSSTTPEEARLATLRSFHIVDSPPETQFDDLAALAAYICEAPISLISFVDEERQWFKAAFGMRGSGSARNDSFCAHAIHDTDLLVVSDATKDERFANNPFVLGYPGIRYYLGAPLIAPNGSILGTLCVIDNKPREVTKDQSKALTVLSRQVMALLESREQAVQMARSKDALLNILEDERRAQAAKAQSEERIAQQAALLDETRDAIIVRDLKGVILFWNKGAAKMYGWESAEVVGQDLDGFLYADKTKFQLIQDLTIENGQWSGELQHLTRDKTPLTVEVRWTLIRDAEGNPKSTLSINTDITEKKRIEGQFMRAQRMESIGTLAGGIAHDLNNILAPIIMSIDLLKRNSDGPRTTKILEAIEVSAKRGADIVRQVLSFARGIEGQRIEVQPKHLILELENIIRDTFPKDIRLHFEFADNPWTMLGDPTQVHQVLLNLSLNARDAMPDGGTLTLTVENTVLDEQYAAMHSHLKPGRYVKVTVTDSGHGIPPKLIEKIFEPFFTTKDLNKGTGLGLSTVAAIVKSHDGAINVYSTPGTGTTFTVYFPAMDMPPGAAQTQRLPTTARGRGETVLLVDDESSIRTITAQTLEAYGYKVLTATDGADAVAVFAANRNAISLVLTDMMMPVMDGRALIHALRRIEPSVRIIAASGLTANGEPDKPATEGVAHFLIKPYTAELMLDTIRRVLDESPVDRT
jgi:PAS domain S-box-containing protein